MVATSARVLSVGPYELWFVSQLTLGLVYIGGAMFLLPPFTLSLPGAGPADVGIVMAMLPLIALGAPVVGGMLDKYGSYRIFQLVGLGLFAVGFGLLALVDELIGATLGALILGVGAALTLTSNMSLMAGSGLPDGPLNSKMSLLQMSLPLGQFLGLVVIALLFVLGATFSGIFLAMAGLALLGLLVTALTNGPAERRALEAIGDTIAAPQVDEPKERGGLSAVVLSTFGLVLLVVFISMAAHSIIESQYANFMGKVFGIDGEIAAAALAVVVLLSVPFYPLVGRWVRRAPYRTPLLVGIAARGLAGLALWLIADIAGLPAIVPLALYGVIMVVMALTDVGGALLAARTSPIGPSGGQGGFGFALAAAGVTGAFVAGWAASEFGYASVALLVGVFAGIAFILALLIPRLRSASPEDGVTEV